MLRNSHTESNRPAYNYRITRGKKMPKKKTKAKKKVVKKGKAKCCECGCCRGPSNKSKASKVAKIKRYLRTGR